MPKSGWGVVVSVLFNVAVWVAPGIPDTYRWTAFGVTMLLLLGACIWWWLSPKTTTPVSDPAAQNIKSSKIIGSNVASARRDVHQHIYQPFRDLEKLADFVYDGGSSKINFGFVMDAKANKPRGEINLELRFMNKGEGIAHNIGADIHGCWIHDESPKAVRIDHEQTSGRVLPGEGRKLFFRFTTRYAKTTRGQLTLHSHKDILVMLIEIIFSKLPTSPEVCRNEPIWLTWTPQIPTALCDSKQSEVQIARLAIDKSRPPS